jgi:hypothetical protein
MESTPPQTVLDIQRDGVPQPRRRGRLLWVGAGIAIAIAVGGAALGGVLPGVPLRAGPLEGVDGVYASLPVRPTDTGVLWGVLNLENRSGSPIVLDSVTVAENPDHLPLLKPPYIWDEFRVKTLGFNGTDAYQLPLPAKWKLPPERKVSGFELKSRTSEQIDQGEVGDGEVPSVEVLFEFAPPKKPTKLNGITVRYHIGPLAYRRTFDTSIVFCPINDLGPCAVTDGG